MALTRLGRGELPLARAFWDYAMIYGTMLNLTTTVAALAVLVTGYPYLAVVVFFLPLPYNVLTVIGVWRSAARYPGPAKWATLARGAVVVWAAIATVI